MGVTLAGKTSREWFEMMVEAGLPCGPVYNIRDAFADPQVEALRIERPVTHPRLGEIDLIAQPCEITGFDRAIRRRRRISASTMTRFCSRWVMMRSD